MVGLAGSKYLFFAQILFCSRSTATPFALRKFSSRSAVLSSSLLKLGMEISSRNSVIAAVCNVWIDVSGMYNGCSGLPGKKRRQLLSPPDDDLAHAAVQGGKGIVQFRYHPGKDDLLFFQLLIIGRIDASNDGIIVIRIQKHTALFKGIDQAGIKATAKRTGHFLCNGIGIGLQQLPVPFMG